MWNKSFQNNCGGWRRKGEWMGWLVRLIWVTGVGDSAVDYRYSTRVRLFLEIKGVGTNAIFFERKRKKHRDG